MASWDDFDDDVTRPYRPKPEPAADDFDDDVTRTMTAAPIAVAPRPTPVEPVPTSLAIVPDQAVLDSDVPERDLLDLAGDGVTITLGEPPTVTSRARPRRPVAEVEPGPLNLQAPPGSYRPWEPPTRPSLEPAATAPLASSRRWLVITLVACLLAAGAAALVTWRLLAPEDGATTTPAVVDEP